MYEVIVILKALIEIASVGADGALDGQAMVLWLEGSPLVEVAEEAHGVLLERQARRHVVLHHMLVERHGGERNFRFRDKVLAHVRGKQRQRALICC
jgi:hypothetical protein